MSLIIQKNASEYDKQDYEHGERVRCTPYDPIECTGRNPECVYSKHTNDYRCCSDIPQDLSTPPGAPEKVKPICPYGASSYDTPSVYLCDPTKDSACPSEYTCEKAVNHEMLTTYNMHLCCKSSTIDSFENVFYETKVGINKMSSNLSMPLFYVTSLSPSIIPHAPGSGIDYVSLRK
uniref:CC domain-containing protein n=1 Tax=Heterorhabditis bacteriophora TaxID=37862 RepID=A0A1I7XU14_HETBA